MRNFDCHQGTYPGFTSRLPGLVPYRLFSCFLRKKINLSKGSYPGLLPVTGVSIICLNHPYYLKRRKKC